MYGESINLNFGPYSCCIGSKLWNIQHNLLGCAENRDFLDVEQMFVETGNSYTPRAMFFDFNESKYSWYDSAKFRYEPKSICSLPIWKSSSEPFDMFYQGYRECCGCVNFLPNEIWEDIYIDNFRRIIEECDHLRSINTIFDSYNAFGGVMISFIQDLLDDLVGRSVCLVNYGITEDPECVNSNITTHSSVLKRLNTPFMIANTCSYSNPTVTMPLNLSPIARRVMTQIAAEEDEEEGNITDTRDTVSSVIAGVMESVMGCTRLSPVVNMSDNGEVDKHHSLHNETVEDEISDGGYDDADDQQHIEDNLAVSSGETVEIREWVNGITKGGRYPVAHLEAYLPFGLSAEPHSRREDHGATMVDHISRSMGSSTDSAHSYSNTYSMLNAFENMSLSTMYYHYTEVKPKKKANNSWMSRLTNRAYRRSFTNSVFIRGCHSQDIQTALFSACLQSNYLVSACHMRSAGIAIDKRESLHFLRNIHACNASSAAGHGSSSINSKYLIDQLFPYEAASTSYLYASSMAAVGTDEAIGHWCHDIGASWGEITGASSRYEDQVTKGLSHHLEKFGYQRDSAIEVYEKLLNMREVYSVHDDEMDNDGTDNIDT